uniref:Uncharacterized protein n=1 Tax=Salix viminalis TaxID=40686 RepID=A0A6N2MBR4_SALVM
MFPASCCSQGLEGTGLPREFAVATVFPPAAGTISPGLAVPDASTTSLVLPGDGGLKGVGPDDDGVPARSHACDSYGDEMEKILDKLKEREKGKKKEPDPRVKKKHELGLALKNPLLPPEKGRAPPFNFAVLFPGLN